MPGNTEFDASVSRLSEGSLFLELYCGTNASKPFERRPLLDHLAFTHDNGIAYHIFNDMLHRMKSEVGQKVDGRREPLAQAAYGRIKGEILDQRLLPRQPLVEAELAAQYGMSKTPIREALLTLAREGLVEFSPFRGGRVRDFTADDAREIYEVRELLEPFALERSALHIGEDERRSLRSLFEEARATAESGERRKLARLNRAFHSALVIRCGNERVIGILAQMQDQVTVMSLRLWNVQATHLHEADQHEAVLVAMEAGEIGQAAVLLREHISEFKERYIREWTG